MSTDWLSQGSRFRWHYMVCQKQPYNSIICIVQSGQKCKNLKFTTKMESCNEIPIDMNTPCSWSRKQILPRMNHIKVALFTDNTYYYVESRTEKKSFLFWKFCLRCFFLNNKTYIQCSDTKMFRTYVGLIIRSYLQ